VNEYNMTTAPPANMLQAAQSGGLISRQAFWELLMGSLFRTAFSTANASTPKRQQYAPIARKNDRHIAKLLIRRWWTDPQIPIARATRAGAGDSQREKIGRRATSLGNIDAMRC